jgi:hypothetical protein
LGTVLGYVYKGHNVRSFQTIKQYSTIILAVIDITI